MNDPHVESLTYRLEVGPALNFVNPPPLEDETDHFKLRLEVGTLTVTMKEHHASLDSARARMSPFLRGWEVDNNLTYGPAAFQFVYQDGKVIDRNPPPPGSSQRIELAGTAMLWTGGSATLTVGRPTYPTPPKNFVMSPDMETMWRRFEGFQNGREPLNAMAYFCVTMVEFLGGGTGKGKRQRAADAFNIDKDVIDKLAELVSERGDDGTARKYQPNLQRLSPQEETWIIETVKVFIRRLGEVAARANPLKQVTMGDLPAL